MIAVRLTQAQAEEINGVDRGDGVYFSPMQDVHGQWFISEEEQAHCSAEWIKALPLEQVTIIVQIEP